MVLHGFIRYCAINCLFCLIFVFVGSCQPPDDDKSKSLTNVSKRDLERSDNSTKIISDQNSDSHCSILNLENNGHEIILNYFKKNYYLDTNYKYLPLCIAEDDAELFDVVYMEQISDNASVFLDYFTKNSFTEDERNQIINFFVAGIDSYLGNQVLEKYHDVKDGNLIEEQRNVINNLFREKLSLENEIIARELRDSLFAYNRR